MTTMRDRFATTTLALLDEEPRTALVLADISTDRFEEARRRLPDRVLNVGIREQLMIGVAGGLALTGMRPIVHTIAPFLVERPYEQLKLDLGHQGTGAVLVGIGASYDYSTEGRTHLAPEDVTVIDTLPGWTVQVPGHPDEVEPLLRRSVAADGPVYLRLSDRVNAAPVQAGPGLHLVRAGSATSPVVVAVGPSLDATLAAAEGRDATVLYAATVRPFDAAGLRAATAGRAAPSVVLVEPYLAGTSAHEVSRALGDVPHRLLGLGVRREELRAYGTPADHDALHGLDAAGLRRALDAFLPER